MSRNHTFLRPLLRGLLVVALSCAPALATAEEAEAVEAAAQVQARLSGHTLAPELTEEGEPVLDEAGLPAMRQVPLEESLLVPGQTIHFVLTLENPTPDPVEDLILGAPMAAELRLDPFSIVSDRLIALEWAGEENPEVFAPLFELVDGETVLQADPDDIRALRLGLATLDPGEEIALSYSVVLR